MMSDLKPFVSPEYIFSVGTGFMAAKTVLTAVELDLFTQLAQAPGSLAELEQRLGLHPRASGDFLDALVALGLLDRDKGVYSNTEPAAIYLDRTRDTCIAALLEMADRRLYHYWDRLSVAIRTGEPQNELRDGGRTLFSTLSDDPDRHRLFLSAMTALSRGTNMAIVRRFPWLDYTSVADLGTAQGDLVAQVAQAYPHLSGYGLDLPQVEPIFVEHIERLGVADRIEFVAGDFFRDELPPADVFVMGHILHDWNLSEKKALIARAYDALPAGGALVVYETMIDDARETNVQGLLMSLTMLIETHGGFDYTAADCIAWLEEAGFSDTRKQHLAGAESMVIGIK